MNLENLHRTIARIRPDLLAAVFVSAGVTLPESAFSFTPRNLQPLLDALEQLPLEERKGVGESLELLSRMATPRDSLAMMSAALADWGIAPPSDFADLTAADLAAWCFAHLSEAQCLNLARRAEVLAQPKGEWRFYTLDLDQDPSHATFVAARPQLEAAISRSVVEREFRGHGCEAECYAVNAASYVIFRLTDYPDRADKWDAQARRFVSSDGPLAFRLVFLFETDTHRLGILSEASAERCLELSQVFAKTVFGAFSRLTPVRYNLAPLRHKSDLPAALNLGIRSAKIIEMELWLDGSRLRRRSYYERDRNIQEVIAAELQGGISGPREGDLVKRVRILITYESRRGPDTPKQFIVSEGSVSGMTDPHHGIGKAFKTYLDEVLKVAVRHGESPA